MLDFLLEAAELAIPTSKSDPRSFWLGAIGIRKDGALVSSRNGAVSFSSSVDLANVNVVSHAETRLLRKLGKDGIIFVSRVLRKDRSLAMARPCPDCQLKIRAHRAKKVYYTINDNQFGVWFPKEDKDRVYTV
jgi:hypothetical protein